MSTRAPIRELVKLLAEHADGTLCLARVDHIESVQQAYDAENFPAQQLQNAFLHRLNNCLPKATRVRGLALGEFAWVLATSIDAETINDEILALFQSPFDYERHSAFVTLSIAMVDIGNISDQTNSLLQLDQALRNAQAQGGNRCYRARAPRDVLSQIPSAIEREEFAVYFQGVWSANTQQLIGAEALLRWHGLEINNIDPAQLVQIAEQGNKMSSLGNWILRKACSHASAWLETWARPLTLGLNVSQQQFRSPNFVTNLDSCLENTWMDPKRLQLEIRYSDFACLVERDSSKLLALNKLGVGLCLDNIDENFFTPQHETLRQSVLGHTSDLRIPITGVKIDPALITSLFSSENLKPQMSELKKLLGEFVHACQKEKIRTTAVGIENNDIRKAVAGFGFDFTQGFALGKPLNAKEFTNFARTSVH